MEYFIWFIWLGFTAGPCAQLFTLVANVLQLRRVNFDATLVAFEN